MSGKPVPIDLVPYSDMLGDSREFLSVWAKEGGPVTCFINPVPVGGDPMGRLHPPRRENLGAGHGDFRSRGAYLGRRRRRTRQPDRYSHRSSHHRRRWTVTLNRRSGSFALNSQ
jgi:hypothetical protein